MKLLDLFCCEGGAEHIGRQLLAHITRERAA